MWCWPVAATTVGSDQTPHLPHERRHIWREEHAEDAHDRVEAAIRQSRAGRVAAAELDVGQGPPTAGQRGARRCPVTHTRMDRGENHWREYGRLIDDFRVTFTERPGEPPVTRWTKSTIYLDMWVNPDDDPRESGIPTADERGTLLDYLRRYRLTLEMKCADLNAEQMARRSVPPSTMSLLGLVRHMSEVERHWFRREMAGQDASKIYCTEEDRDGDWNGAEPDSKVVEEAWRTWRAEVAFAEQFAADAAELGTLGITQAPLRDVLVHMIEEYARHCGHADLLRECIDGRVGQ